MSIALTLVLLASLAAAATDAATRRIPNALTVPLALLGLGLNAVHGWHALLTCAALMAAVLLLGTVAHSAGWMGGGDVKLIAAAAGTLNYPDAVSFVLYTAVAGGVVALAAIAFSGRVLQIVRSMLTAGAALAAGVPRLGALGINVPYGVAVAGGASLVALSHTLVPALRLLP